MAPGAAPTPEGKVPVKLTLPGTSPSVFSGPARQKQPADVGKVEFYTGDLPRIIWFERNFWGRSQDYFSTFPTVATGGREEGH